MAVPVPERAGQPILLAQPVLTKHAPGRFERVCLAAEIVAAYIRARRALRRASVTTVVAELRASGVHVRTTALTEDRSSEARRLGRAVTRALAMIPGDTRCLMQALVLVRILQRRGISTTLVIGVRTTPGFIAHAWVEYGGQPVLAAGDGLFDKLAEL